MKILMLEWDSFGTEYIIDAFRHADCMVEMYPWPFGKQEMRENDLLCKELEHRLNNGDVSFVFSLNFFPVAAKACYNCGIRYVSWVYDTPYLLLYSKHIRYETNQVYLFDSSLCAEFKRNGIDNVYYLPMAAPVDIYDKLAGESDSKYKADISFVGSTYKEDSQNFYQLLEGISPYARGYIDAIIGTQKRVYGSFLLEELLREPVLSELRRVCPIDRGEDEWESEAWIYANYFLARRLTGEQRIELLQLLSENHKVRLYTPEATPELIHVDNRGPIDYVSEMPRVFKNTKINLNMTLRSIHTGIPLRAMDIMGCGGFLLTNYQADFGYWFQPDVDYVYYADNEDLLYKADYYLEHEEERFTIAMNGYQKVKEAHTYHHRVRTILEGLK
ncbi:MAG: glycosyltransferase [Lachnospiraceae bacterium]|nr:glycosyltransferase [Lachnospiraceae bacterium]